MDRALADVVRRFAIPRELPEALFEGFAWDACGRRYADLAELQGYAARVAGTVGAMMALLMGVRDPEALARACDLGVAMQLSNIARDVGEDARAGRLYCRSTGCVRSGSIPMPGWHGRSSARGWPPWSSACYRGGQLYGRASGGIAHLPPGCRPGIQAARFLYAEMAARWSGAASIRSGHRAVVPLPRKLGLLARALVARSAAGTGRPGTAARSGPLSGRRRGRPRPIGRRHGARVGSQAIPWWNLVDRWIRVFEMFERLEKLDRRDGAGPFRQVSR